MCIPFARPFFDIAIPPALTIHQTFSLFLLLKQIFSYLLLLLFLPTGKQQISLSLSLSLADLFRTKAIDSNTLPFAPSFMFYHATTILFACDPVSVTRPFCSSFSTFYSFFFPAVPRPFQKIISFSPFLPRLHTNTHTHTLKTQHVYFVVSKLSLKKNLCIVASALGRTCVCERQ